MLLRLYHYFKCATRGANILDKVYSNLKLGFRASPLPHLGQSDHLFLLLRKTASPITKIVKTWPVCASQQMQDYFDRTDWDVFKHPDLKVLMNSVLCCIKNSIDTITVNKHIWVYLNQKPCVTREALQLLEKRNTAYRSTEQLKHT